MASVASTPVPPGYGAAGAAPPGRSGPLPLTDAELDYLREVERHKRRRLDKLLSVGICVVAFCILYIPYHVVSGGLRSGAWPAAAVVFGLACLVTGAWLLRWALRFATEKHESIGTMNFRVLRWSGRFRTDIWMDSHGLHRELVIDRAPVSFPAHWRKTLRKQARHVTVLAAATGDLRDPLPVIEIENGPSIAFERANVAAREPAPKPLTRLAAWVAGLLALLGLFNYWALASRGRTDWAHTLAAARVAYLPPSTYRDGDALAGATPVPGRVVIEAAWRFDDADRSNSRLRTFKIVLITQAARDRIVAEREAGAAAPVRLRPQDVVAEVDTSWVYRPPPSDYNKLAGLFEAQCAAAAHLPPRAPEGTDRVLWALRSPVRIDAELYSLERRLVLSAAGPLLTEGPLQLYARNCGWDAELWRKAASSLLMGGGGLLVLLPLAVVLLHHRLRRRAFVAKVRAAYAKRGYRLV